MEFLRSRLNQETLERNRWLRWLMPHVKHPEFWHLDRSRVAKAAAMGAFVAFVLPFGQIPLAAAIAFWLRWNIPTAIGATFINTPLTFGPVYYGAYKLGQWLLDGGSAVAAHSHFAYVATGTLAIATACSVLVYLGVHAFWSLRRKTQPVPDTHGTSG